MSNNKQSSVEWFIDQLEEKGKAYAETVGVRTVNICIDVSEYMELKQQAKAMHKEEHGQTWDKSMENFEARGRNEMRAWVDFDEYYNETYESNS